jgi:hypothetical protein
MTMRNRWSLALVLIAATGCIRRYDLTAAELQLAEDKERALTGTRAPAAAEAPPAEVSAAPVDVLAVPGAAAEAQPQRIRLDHLRVYVGRKLRSYYPQAQDPLDYNLTGGRIRLRGAYRPFIAIISRNVPGMVIDEDTYNGMRRLWVTFDPDCLDRTCAYGFVYTGPLDRFSLVDVPEVADYKEAVSYRRLRMRRNLMRHQKQRSLAEINEVLAVKRRRTGKVLTVNLQVRKDTYRPTRAVRDRKPGVPAQQ